MDVILAKTAGFCFGVKRAVDLVYEKIEEQEKAFADTGKKKRIFTLGPIIHNETVVSELESKGVCVLEEKTDGFYAEQKDSEGQTNLIRIPETDLADAVIIIRSHGITKQTMEKLEITGAEIADATCPFVKKIHKIVKEESENDKQVVVIGDADHPEVQGIISYSKNPPIVIGNREIAEEMPQGNGAKIAIVSQTTYNYNKFQELVEILTKKAYDISCVNTICHATSERQQEAQSIAKQVDCMIVIGGTHSSNSRKLFEICGRECENTYFIQTPGDLHLDLPKSVKSVGITAGASTPNNIIEEVQNHVRTIF
ncbi:MAG: 4-hydroxy-3-methylbut-2-enyl diphosphate reductase [Lachnospiraceae bacterium]|nr:4-hydroxy-3-methylbut-2-enyl diphosphate reductase [Lachnospiraceae bacterium]